MSRSTHLPSLLIGLLFGVGGCLLFLRVAGLVSAEVALVGQFVVPVAIAVNIALMLRERRETTTDQAKQAPLSDSDLV